MKKLLGICTGIDLLLILGIVGAVEQGAPISNMLWCVPLLGMFALCAKLGGFME